MRFATSTDTTYPNDFFVITPTLFADVFDFLLIDREVLKKKFGYCSCIPIPSPSIDALHGR